jgi:hypothetical protein
VKGVFIVYFDRDTALICTAKKCDEQAINRDEQARGVFLKLVAGLFGSLK